VIEVLLETEYGRVVSGRKLAQVVIVREAMHRLDQTARLIWTAWGIGMGEYCMPVLWWMLNERLDGPNAGIDCILEHRGLVRVVGGRLDAHGRVVLPTSSFRGLEWVHLHLHLWDRHWARP
jgi:hypothetical protein